MFPLSILLNIDIVVLLWFSSYEKMQIIEFAKGEKNKKKNLICYSIT